MKIGVDNLARISNAEVEMKNLTLFVGQNSTHKSYMAHVLYEFYKEVASLKNNYGVLSRFVNTISKKIQQNFQSELEYLLSLKNEYIEGIEQHQIDVGQWQDEEFTILKIYFTDNDKRLVEFFSNINSLLFGELSKKINDSFNINKDILQKLYIKNFKKSIKKSMSVTFSAPLEHFSEDEDEIKYRVVNTLVRDLITTLTNELDNYHSSYYFPASRTGFVLTLDEIYVGIFRDKFRGQVSATRLGEPTIDFIQTFADIKTGKINELMGYPNLLLNKRISNKSKKLVDFLEKNIIKGKIKEVRNEQDYASYYLEINGEDLDLHLASSATLETLPFIVFLKNTKDISNTFFVIEEPEAHLHPKAQIQMARFIVMLSNAGAKVLVTTHSDYILNEINNCIKLNSIDTKDNFAISKDSVSAYLFKNQKEITSVNPLKIDKYGIANDNFDEVLDELLERSSELSETILDDK